MSGTDEHLYKYSTATKTWTKLDDGAAVEVVSASDPSAREGHSMTGVGQDIYLFGGDASGE